jgi:uncharacterized membrane protein
VKVRAGGTRLRLWWDNAFWVIPLAGLVAAVVLDAIVAQIDQELSAEVGGAELWSPSSAVTFLASIGGGMITFTGFVFSLVLLIIQFGSATYSPRTVSYFLRSRVTQGVLAIFVGTSAYAFLALISIGSAGRESYVPFFGVLVCLVCLLASLVAFLVLIQSVAGRIRVDSLIADLGRIARRAVTRRPASGSAAEPAALDAQPAASGTVLRHRGEPGQIVAIDVDRAVRGAARFGVEIVFRVRVGDAIAPGAAVGTVSWDGAVSPAGSVDPAQERAVGELVDQCLLVHRERSLKYDPLYALRILSDIGLRALSAAINDPTTAVRALDEAEAVLRVAAPLPLGPVRVSSGRGGVVAASFTWNDIVDLALWEVLEAGLQSPQVTRRLTALLDDLLADLPAERHDPLLRHRARLRAAVTASTLTDPGNAEAAGPWLIGDRQGLGGQR